MSKFKVGDRVAAYNCTKRYIGVVRDLDNRRPPMTLVIETDDDTLSFHPKQCRLLKLKPKSVRVTREKLFDVWQNIRVTYRQPKESAMDQMNTLAFNALCKELGLE